jgi:hypothetical protein
LILDEDEGQYGLTLFTACAIAHGLAEESMEEAMALVES